MSGFHLATIHQPAYAEGESSNISRSTTRGNGDLVTKYSQEKGLIVTKKKNRENPRESNIQFSVGIVYSDNSEIVKRAVLFDF